MTRGFILTCSLLIFATPACAQEKKELVRVACIGDSITYGSGVMDREKNCYPAVLQSLLGDTYDVRNDGVGGATLLARGDKPYSKESAFKKALDFNPHIVVIALGTNDTKPMNWKHADDFTADYKALIEAFRKNGQPKVYLCTPVPAYLGNFGIDDERIRTGVKPKVEELGKALDLPVIDLYAALSDKKAMFPDQVHPDADGAKLMAETVFRSLAAK